jgi:hypothetical protein
VVAEDVVGRHAFGGACSCIFAMVELFSELHLARTNHRAAADPPNPGTRAPWGVRIARSPTFESARVAHRKTPTAPPLFFLQVSDHGTPNALILQHQRDIHRLFYAHTTHRHFVSQAAQTHILLSAFQGQHAYSEHDGEKGPATYLVA